ncbi:hypothetical protein S7711_03468 [Stachybotrys chartarum IBT 7711]|uniref:Uncharacterized protein n=1 Tax=Stachybotrys chartarum (strain CBS 109288 / IBT 7711) TaxID=1280523 RepID=A0A084AFU6_STACB|nr:hypothetical protein S7711_03468 [Stachybotrys chartarum IBT 7711]KFA55286.1 hypothetical protein S40293_04949 [Stachybotrys chartarum IBT 40293]KFA77426.1 hypothetical protein S40288_03088 [Stachybotrys chartarum IBT 40288]
MLTKTVVISSFLLASARASPLVLDQRQESAIEWAPCDLDLPESLEAAITEPLDCATLQVPLDYTDPDSEPLNLQLIRVNANREPVDKSVIFNPGGPGGSGIQEIIENGVRYRDILGGHHSIIGFDARGSGRTIPFICDLTSGPSDGSPGCGSNLTARNAYAVIPQENPYDILISKAWEDGKWLADACAASQNDTARFYGTSFVARDLVAIVDALDEDGLIRFWGRSYSTVLGQTVAAMFPDRVERMLLEAVVLAEDFNSGRWLAPTRDVEASLSNFFQECINAGPRICSPAGFHGNATTVQSLLEEMAEVLQELIDEPAYISRDYPIREWWRPADDNTVYIQLKFVIMNALSNPAGWITLASVIQNALDRDWTLFTNPAPTPPPEETWNLGLPSNFHGIACSDSTFRASRPEELYSLAEAQSSQGSFADAFSPQVWVCAHWKFDAAERYTGSWDNIRTRAPIMLVNSRYDPITPLSAAQETAVRFRDSRLFIHEGVGHGVASQPSNCTYQIIGNYFANGTLPAMHTTCESDFSVWDIAAAAAEAQAEASGAQSVY